MNSTIKRVDKQHFYSILGFYSQKRNEEERNKRDEKVNEIEKTIKIKKKVPFKFKYCNFPLKFLKQLQHQPKNGPKKFIPYLTKQ